MKTLYLKDKNTETMPQHPCNTVLEAFREQAKARPDHIALVF